MNDKRLSLTDHGCINLRLPPHDSIYAWEFEKDGRELKVRVEGPLIFNNIVLRLNAALAGLGLANLTEDQVQPYINNGRLIRVLEDWCVETGNDSYRYKHSTAKNRKENIANTTL